ncbi:MAG: hypothetical protein P8Y70_21405 [Candidatus Lokiarchaeota archaeon]
MDQILIGTIGYSINIVLSLLFAGMIIDKLYVSKKFSKENDFHFYNDLFSWEMFFIFIAIENIIRVVTLFLSINPEILRLILRIRILILFFPFWNKIIHLEKVMNIITYERHYLGGMIPLIIAIILLFSDLPDIQLIYVFLIACFFPFLIFFIFFKNNGTTKKKSLKVIIGAFLIVLGFILQPGIVYSFDKIALIPYLFLILISISSPISYIIGSLIIFLSFRREL